MNETFLDNYDIFLTTEKNKFYDNGLAMYIAPFPTENDRRNIKLLLDGFADLEDILYVFHRDSFFVSDNGGDKAEILHLLASRAEKKFSLVGLHAGMLEREKIGSTFFSKGIAIPHPLHSISSDTFVAVYISKKSYRLGRGRQYRSSSHHAPHRQEQSAFLSAVGLFRQNPGGKRLCRQDCCRADL